MKIVSVLIHIVLWIAAVVFFVFIGWMLKAYQVRRDNAR